MGEVPKSQFMFPRRSVDNTDKQKKIKMATSTQATRNEIGELSTRVEDVLLLLLTDLENLKSHHDKEVETREKEANEIRYRLDTELTDLRDKLASEEAKRETDAVWLQDLITEIKKEAQTKRDQLKEELDHEHHERIRHTQDIDNYFRQENEDRKRNLDEFKNWMREENEKRASEVEGLRHRMEREKQELLDAIEKESKTMQDLLKSEEDERVMREREMKDRLKEQTESSGNEIVHLHKRATTDNAKRIEEIEDLNRRLKSEKEDLRQQMERGKADIIERLERENQALKDQMEASKSGLKGNIDDNNNDSNKKMIDLASKLTKISKDSSTELKDLNNRLAAETQSLKNLISKPLSIYFNAFRTEDYLDGGEDYLTFQGTHCNLGNGMDARSGIFTAPYAGSYMFAIHACTHAMNKALMSIRRNGNQVASFYDENHDSHHKNSMVGQSVILELEVGDKVQVYMYAGTGLQDQHTNHLTQFVGLFLRPKDFMKNETPISGASGGGILDQPIGLSTMGTMSRKKSFIVADHPEFIM